MDLMLLILILLLLLLLSFSPSTLQARKLKHTTRITVAGVVYCDSCSNNGLSRHSYFLPGVDVNIRCKFKAISPKTAEQVTFSVNRTTDKYGVYKLEIPSVDGVDCVDGLSIESLCQASLLGSSSPSCDVPVLKTTTKSISAKSKQDNLCLYSLNAMSYRPSVRNVTLCTNQNEELAMAISFNSSKFFLPYFPPYGFFWPPMPLFPFPPLPSLPFPPLPPLPFPPLPPFPSLPPFPFPPLPPFPYLPFPPFPFPSAPPFPPVPFLSAPPPPPAFDLRDPRTWIPNIPPLSFPSPPPPPAFSLTDPRTWTPYIPIPSPPYSPQDQNP